MKLFTFATIFVIFILIFYLKILRPWQLRWGATDDEVKCTMSGDDIVQKPNFVATRAVSILILRGSANEAPPTEVWKWIIQIGSRRAGFYSCPKSIEVEDGEESIAIYAPLNVTRKDLPFASNAKSRFSSGKKSVLNIVLITFVLMPIASFSLLPILKVLEVPSFIVGTN
jgi:hypothetical protein